MISNCFTHRPASSKLSDDLAGLVGIALGIDLCHIGRCVTENHLSSFEAMFAADFGCPGVPDLIRCPAMNVVPFLHGGFSNRFHLVAHRPSLLTRTLDRVSIRAGRK